MESGVRPQVDIPTEESYKTQQKENYCLQTDITFSIKVAGAFKYFFFFKAQSMIMTMTMTMTVSVNPEIHIFHNKLIIYN